MADVIRMPRLSDTMQEGVIKSWNKNVGDTVKPGDILAEVETDKATMDLEAFQNGTILHIQVKEGPVPVDGIIAIIGKSGEDFSSLLTEKEVIKESDILKTESPKEPSPSQDQSSTTPEASSRIKASPLAKSIAKEKGLKLESITGSGENGRIIKRDLEGTAKNTIQQATTLSLSHEGDREVVNSQMRKTISKRLSESKFSAPHFYLTMEIDMDSCVAARNNLNAISPSKISYNDIIIKAVASALRLHPAVNVSWYSDKMIYHTSIHIGVAVAVEEGLVVPVIQHADQKSLLAIKNEITDKATRAKEKKLTLEEMQGNTFTISNLGMFDIEEFTAIINPPDACILAVGSIVKKPVVKDDQIVISSRMKLTLSCDHRAVDGATGAQFLQTLKNLLEQPISLIL